MIRCRKKSPKEKLPTLARSLRLNFTCVTQDMKTLQFHGAEWQLIPLSICQGGGPVPKQKWRLLLLCQGLKCYMGTQVAQHHPGWTHHIPSQVQPSLCDRSEGPASTSEHLRTWQAQPLKMAQLICLKKNHQKCQGRTSLSWRSWIRRTASRSPARTNGPEPRQSQFRRWTPTLSQAPENVPRLWRRSSFTIIGPSVDPMTHWLPGCHDLIKWCIVFETYNM